MASSFLGYTFMPIELNQRNVLAGYLERFPQPLSGFTFASLATWQEIFEYGWVLAEGETLLISCLLDPERRRHLMQPVGPFQAALQDRLLREAASLSYSLKVVGVNADFLSDHPGFVERFRVFEDRAASNYLYRADDLAGLPGRKYSKKRNLLAQAEALYRWVTEPLTAAGVDACFEVLDRIREEEQPAVDSNLAQELAALDYTLRQFAELGQRGLLIRADGRPAAFSIFEPIGPSTVAIHFERALRAYKGLYQVINWETARVIAAGGFEFINREEDLGNPGLRDAKRSYHPVRLIPAYELTWKGAVETLPGPISSNS